jgi:hypothetical protein
MIRRSNDFLKSVEILAPDDLLSFSSAVMCDQSFLSSAKSRDLFGKGVQGNPLPEREVSSHLLLFPKNLW